MLLRAYAAYSEPASRAIAKVVNSPNCDSDVVPGMGSERKAVPGLALDSDEKAAGAGRGLLRAGLELGAWSFLGTALQVRPGFWQHRGSATPRRA